MKIIEYDVSLYNFVEEITSLYQISNLSDIHNQWSGAKNYDILDDVKTDQLTVYHRKFYDK